MAEVGESVEQGRKPRQKEIRSLVKGSIIWSTQLHVLTKDSH